MRISRIEILLFIFDFVSVTLLINAPNLMVGYGIIIAAMMLSMTFTDPYRGASIFLASHILGSIYLMYTKSAFISVALLSTILRPLVLYIFAYLYRREVLKLPFILILIPSIDTILAYSLALLYYGHDAIEVGLDIYSLVYAPYVYLAYSYYRRGMAIESLTAVSMMILYYLSSAYFYAIALNILSILILIYLVIRYENGLGRSVYAIPLLIIILTPLSLPAIYYNIEIVFYPYNPTTYAGRQWTQTTIDSRCKPGNVFEYVYSPERLRILDTCVAIKGTVVSNIYRYEDGDICFDIKPDPEYINMLSIGSIILRRGSIHIEIVPHDQSRVYIPEKGDYILVVGAFVVDTDHGSWSEIHPAWYIERLSRNTTLAK